MNLQEQAAFRNGNEDEFERLFRIHYASLCSYAYTFVHDRDEAEEVVQGTFLNIWEKRQSLQIETSMKSYLYRSVRNGSLNVIKHRKVRHTFAAMEMKQGEPTEDSAGHGVLKQELESKVFEAMKALPDQCRLVFQLSRFEELRYQEIADQLNVSVKTVENHMGKALKIMRKELKDFLPVIFVLLNSLMAW